MEQMWGVAGIDPHKHSFTAGVVDGRGVRRDVAAFEMTEPGLSSSWSGSTLMNWNSDGSVWRAHTVLVASCARS